MLNRNSEVFYVLKHKHLCSIKASTNLRFSIQLDAHDPDKNRRVKRLLRAARAAAGLPASACASISNSLLPTLVNHVFSAQGLR